MSKSNSDQSKKDYIVTDLYSTKANNELVEAVQYHNDNIQDILTFCGASGRIQQLTGGGEALDLQRRGEDRTTYLWRIKVGEWLVKSRSFKENGGCITLTDEEFNATYESADTNHGRRALDGDR